MDKASTKLDDYVRRKHVIKSFTLESDQQILRKDAHDHMIKQGYHPSGHGFFSFNCGPSHFGSKFKYIASWSCFEDCE